MVQDIRPPSVIRKHLENLQNDLAAARRKRASLDEAIATRVKSVSRLQAELALSSDAVPVPMQCGR